MTTKCFEYGTGTGILTISHKAGQKIPWLVQVHYKLDAFSQQIAFHKLDPSLPY